MAKRKISPENNWGDIMSRLQNAREGSSSNMLLFELWTEADLKPLFRNPKKESKYLRDLTAKSAKKRQKALATAEEFREKMREVFLFIFGDQLAEREREMLVIFCESSANGALSSLIAGADTSLLYRATWNSRASYARSLLELGGTDAG